MGARERRRGGKPLSRTAAKRPERRTIMVFCEGANSEPDYVKALKRLPHISENTALDLQIHPEQGVPLTLVTKAKEYKRDPEIDECWCLFDVEWPQHHPNLLDAVKLARLSGVNLAISNPCFELWLILHFKDHHGFIHTDPAERQSRSLDGRPGKRIDAAVYMPLRKEAARRARHLDKRHERDCTSFPHDNPSTGVYKLLQALEGE